MAVSLLHSQLIGLTRAKASNGRKGALKATSSQSKHDKQEAKMAVSFPKIGQTAIQNNNTNSNNNNNKITRTEIVNHSRITALERSVKYYWGLKSILRGHNPRP